MTDALCPCGNGQADPAVCTHCRLKAHSDLNQIRRDTPTLLDHLDPASSGTPARAVPGSRPPLNIPAVSLAAKGGVGGILGSWCQLLLEDNRITTLPDHRLNPTAHVEACCRRLAGHLDWMLDQDYADELTTELSDLRRDIAQTLGLVEREWLPLPGMWRCPHDDCQGLLLQKVGETIFRCAGCADRWEGDQQLERLQILLGCETQVTVQQAAQLTRVHIRTVWRWIEAGLLPVDASSGRSIVDKRDLALIVARQSA